MSSPTVLVVCVVFTAVLGYFAFVRKGTRRGWARAAFVVGIVVSLFMGYAAWREARALGEISALIRPFPGIQRSVWVPKMPSAQKSWTFRTSEPPDVIYRFYANEEHRQGWNVVVQSNIFFVLRKDETVLSIGFLGDRAAGGSVIVYSLEAASGS